MISRVSNKSVFVETLTRRVYETSENVRIWNDTSSRTQTAASDFGYGNHEGGILERNRGSHLGDIWKACGKHPGGSGGKCTLGGIWEAAGRHLEAQGHIVAWRGVTPQQNTKSCSIFQLNHRFLGVTSIMPGLLQGLGLCSFLMGAQPAPRAICQHRQDPYAWILCMHGNIAHA